MEKILNVPNHIAIIMDGNGRWAKNQNKPRVFGHKAGANTLRKIMEYCNKIGVTYLTVYAFSTENWKRSQEEVDALMFLFKSYIKSERENLLKNKIRFMVSGREDYAFSTENWKRSQEEVDALMFLFKSYIKSERENLLKNKIRFMVSGREEGVNPSLMEAIKELEEATSKDYEMTLNIAFNYGGRAEITDAVNKILKDGRTSITEEEFSKYLYNDIPDPDFVKNFQNIFIMIFLILILSSEQAESLEYQTFYYGR